MSSAKTKLFYTESEKDMRKIELNYYQKSNSVKKILQKEIEKCILAVNVLMAAKFTLRSHKFKSRGLQLGWKKSNRSLRRGDARLSTAKDAGSSSFRRPGDGLE